MTYATAPDGVRIRIHHLGGTGPPLLCVHATGFHGRVWEPFVPRLREHFSIVSFDQRGHGDSDKPESGYDWTKFGVDALAVIDELSLERPAGIGHSAGAAALVFAETDRAGTFAKLVLMDPVTPEPDIGAVMAGEGNPMSERARRRRAVWTSADEMIDRLQKGTPLSGWREEFLRAYVTFGTEELPEGGVRLKCPPEIEAQIYTMGGRHNGWDRMENLHTPTLLLTGTDSPMWFDDRHVKAVDRLPNGHAERIRGGHFFPMENPDETVDHALRFLVDGAPR